MDQQIILCVGLAVLALLCLPLAGLQKLVLELSAWVLRLILLALLGGAAYLLFRPEQLPAEVIEVLNRVPALRDLLPAPASPSFGAAVARPAAAALVPLLAVLDVCRRLAGRRLRGIDTLIASPVTGVVTAPPADAVTPRHLDRRSAAGALAAAG